MRRIKVYAEICAGCRQCEMVCSFKHTGKFSPSLARVTVIKDDGNGLDYPVMCHHCIQCPPMETCPTGAILKTTEGRTRIDWQSCIRCGVCVDVCKYKAVKLTDKIAIICDLCNGDPECVKRCPTNSIEYIEAPESTETPEIAFNRLKEEWSLE